MACALSVCAGPASAEPLPVRPAAEFVDSVGVQTHGDYFDTAYADAARVVRTLQDLGIRHVRDGVSAGPDAEFNARHDDYLLRLARAGIRANLIIPLPEDGRGTLDELLAAVRDRLLPVAESLEGPNEHDLSDDPEWASVLRAYQEELYGKVEADPQLRGLPVLGPALGRTGNYAELGDLSAWMDSGNLHPYPGGLPPGGGVLETVLEAARETAGSRPLTVTETGYHNALGGENSQPPVSQRAAAAYVPRLYLDHFARGIPRTFVYELLDEKPDPERLEQELNFGLFEHDFTPKPAARTLGNLLEIVGGGEGGSPTAALDVELTGEAEGARRLALSQPDGATLLLLWQDVSVWDRAARRDLDPPALEGEVELPGDARRIDVHRLTSGPDPVDTIGSTTSTDISIPADDILVLRLTAPTESWRTPVAVLLAALLCTAALLLIRRRAGRASVDG